jgi:7-carboxy-7-deazaguanine synthase
MTLRICEIFRSLQGETAHVGLPCGFIRLAGCNLDCRFCDTQYARQGGTPMELDELLEKARALDTELMAVTGGEPLLQPEAPTLLARLADEGHRVLLETNGSIDVGSVDPRVIRIVDIKCPGSGMADHNRWRNLETLRDPDQVKFVISSREDFDYMTEVVARHDLLSRLEVLASPAAGRLSPRSLADWLLSSGLRIRLQLQLHRVLWPERQKGT